MVTEIQKIFNSLLRFSNKIISLIFLGLSLFNQGDIQYTFFLATIIIFTFFFTGLTFGRKFVLSPLCIFFLFYYFYSSTFPFLFFYGKINFFSVEEIVLLYTYSYSVKFASIICCIFCFFPKYFLIDSIDIVHNEKKEIDFQFAFFCMCLFLVELIYFFISGYLNYFLSGSKSRVDINIYVKSYNVWSYLGYINLFVLIKLLLCRGNNLIKKMICSLPLFFYFFVSIFSGSRKQLLYVILIITFFHVSNIVKIKKKFFFVFITLFLGATFYRLIVMDKGLQGNIFNKGS